MQDPMRSPMRSGTDASREPRRIRYRILECPLGWLLVAASARGICQLRFGDDPQALERELEAKLPFAALARDAGSLDAAVEALEACLRGEGGAPRLALDEGGSPFQRRVWAAIREVPSGATRSYAELARAVGRPTAARAVARACGANPLALVTPCHRVVASDGRPGGYRYGLARKRALLEAERAAAVALPEAELRASR